MDTVYCRYCGTEYNRLKGDHLCDTKELDRRVSAGDYDTYGERDAIIAHRDAITAWRLAHPGDEREVAKL